MAAADSYFMNRLPKKLTDLDLGASGLVDRLRRASTTTKVAVCVSVAGGVLLLRYLGNERNEAWAICQQAWEILRPRLTGQPAHVPRIWLT